jgi:hypothetical protein
MAGLLIRIARAAISGATVLLLTGLAAFAQVDFTGEYLILNHWDTIKRVGGPEVGDYTGLPLSAAGRARAESWEASLWTVPEYQCIPHTNTYAERGFGGTNYKWWREIDPRTQKVIAERTRGTAAEPERWIYTDGRPHPPAYAAHTWLGFSTGKWEGNTLVVETTHLKEGYIERNGVANSDRAVVTENWTLHGNYLNDIAITYDPIYLTEPLVRSVAWIVDKHLESGFARNPCGPNEMTTEVDRPLGAIPNILPGTNAQLFQFPATYGLPFEATRGYAEALYPEYKEKMKGMKPMTKGDIGKFTPPLHGQ